MPIYFNIYLPSSLDNNNYIYRLSDDSTIQIITNNNCSTQYTTNYCDCFDYSLTRGVKSSVYSCNRNQSGRVLVRSDIGFDDNLAKYQSTLYSWGMLILVIGAIWSICFYLMKSR